MHDSWSTVQSTVRTLLLDEMYIMVTPYSSHNQLNLYKLPGLISLSPNLVRQTSSSTWNTFTWNKCHSSKNTLLVKQWRPWRPPQHKARSDLFASRKVKNLRSKNGISFQLSYNLSGGTYRIHDIQRLQKTQSLCRERRQH